MTDRYALLAVTGLSPQVLTETVWALADEGYGLPDEVHVVTTGTGARFVDAVLLDRPAAYKARPIEPQGPGWARLAEALGAPLPAPLVTAPTRPGEQAPLDDLTTSPDAALVADALYQRAHDLTAPGRPPLVASIAGGRKTMSADLQSAFSVYARPGDRLVHVLVDPAHERSDFLFPTPQTGDAGLTLVDVRVPRLRRLLEGPLLEALPADRRGLQGILAGLEPVNYVDRPARAELAPGAGPRKRAALRLLGADGAPLDALELKPSDAATLAVFADALARAPAVTAAYAARDPNVQRQRAAVWAWSGYTGEPKAWEGDKDVSDAVSDLKKALAAVPRAAHALTVAGVTTTEATRYGWAAGQAPPLALDFSGAEGNAALAARVGARWHLDGAHAPPTPLA